MAEAPLDLRAVATRLHATEVCYECRADMQALLVHCRALRAALRESLTLSPSHHLFPNAHAIHERAASVLAAAQDGESP